MFQKNSKILIGGALIGTLLGALNSILKPKRKYMLSQMANQTKGWTDKVRNMSQNVLNEVDHWRTPPQGRGKFFASGTLFGMLVGVGAALLLTPRSGKQLRTELTKKYYTLADKTQEILNFMNHEHLNGIKKRPVIKSSRQLIKTAKSKIRTR